MTIDEILGHFDGVTRQGQGQWKVRCSVPDHPDRTASVSVKATSTKALLHCFEGCAVERVIAAAGLTMVDR